MNIESLKKWFESNFATDGEARRARQDKKRQKDYADRLANAKSHVYFTDEIGIYGNIHPIIAIDGTKVYDIAKDVDLGVVTVDEAGVVLNSLRRNFAIAHKAKI